jgi:hypothetical protein
MMFVLPSVVAVLAPPPQFPRRFSAAVAWQCPGDVACGGLGDVAAVYQDLGANNSALMGLRSGEPWGPGYVYDNVLVTTPLGGEAALTRFVWQWQTPGTRCSQRPANRSPGPFFAPAVSVLEGHETIGGVACEKWTNGVQPSHQIDPPDMWAVWFAVVPASGGARDGGGGGGERTVAKVSYTQQTNPMHGFPIPGWTYEYLFTNFTTGPIPSWHFEPPPGWETACATPPPTPAPTPPTPAPPTPPPTPKPCSCFACGDAAAKAFPAGTKCAPERGGCSGESPPAKGCFNVECDPDGSGVPNGVCLCDGAGECVKSQV